jgi:hypothetical protein
MMETKEAKKSRKLIALVLIAALLAMISVPVILFGNQARSLATLRKVDDYPLYVMHRYGYYEFDEYLQVGLQANGGRATAARERVGQWACSCFSTVNEDGQAILGRNFDWYNRPTLLLFAHPPDGYASASMVDISYLGLDTSEPSWSDRIQLLSAPYLPFDGMNEAGLAVGMMAVPSAQASHDPQKVTIDSLAAIRLLLDNAGSVDEAISLLQAHNVAWGGGPPLHYLVADAAGDSAVVEYVGGEMKVLRNKDSWQVSTNFVLSGQDPESAKSLCWRYRKAYETLEQANGDISRPEALDLLEEVSQELTMWSVVYDMTGRDISAVMGRHFDRVHEFELRMRDR